MTKNDNYFSIKKITMLQLITSNRIRGQALEAENEQLWNKMLSLEKELNERIDIFNKSDRSGILGLLNWSNDRHWIDERWNNCNQLLAKHAVIQAEIDQIKAENRKLLVLYLLNYKNRGFVVH